MGSGTLRVAVKWSVDLGNNRRKPDRQIFLMMAS
jgi:hypothetical protein